MILNAASASPAQGSTVSPALRPDGTPRDADSLLPLIQEIWFGIWQRDAWTTSSTVRLCWVFALVTICSWLGIDLSHQSEGVATIWLSNGLVFGLLITQPRRLWLAYFLVGLMADTIADVFYGDPLRIAIGVSLANSLEVVTSTLLLTRWFGSPLDLSRRRTLVGFLLVAVLGATSLTSAIGAWWTLLLLGGPSWWQMFRTWYLGDMLGMALLVPLVMTVQKPAFFSMFERRHLPHTLLVLVASMTLTALVFTHDNDPLIFFIFPAFIVVVFRLGMPGTVVNIFLFTLLAIGFTIKGHGPLMLIAGEHMLLRRVVVAQLFAAVAIFTMFPVAALLEEKEALKDSLAASEARYRTLAHADELTGLPNRRAFNVQLEAAWQSALTSGRSLALLILDADRFKEYNDRVGHIGGDECLRSIGQATAAIVEAARGFAARIGGEEFAVILPECTTAQALSVAEQIRKTVEDLALPHPFSSCGVQTVSLGVAVRVPLDNQLPVDMMRQADEALYAAKLAGRNQVFLG